MAPSRSSAVLEQVGQPPSGGLDIVGNYPFGLSVHGQYMVVSVPFGPFFGNSCWHV